MLKKIYKLGELTLMKNYIKQEYNYEITDRKIDNTISFKLQIKDKVGNENIVELGGSEGYLVPATISTSYKEVEKNKVKINFYKGKSTQKCVATKYEKIEIKRKFSLKKQNSETEYEEITGKTLKYGVFAASLDKLQGGDIFENGVANENAICAEIKATEFSAFDLKITGFEDSQKETKLALGAYVAIIDGENTEYSYMQDDTKGELNGKYYFASYNDITGKSLAN